MKKTGKERDEEFQKSYKKYLAKNESVVNDRIRPDKQNFFDALMSEDMKNDPDRKRGIEIIKAL
jgi:hypothetical protein